MLTTIFYSPNVWVLIPLVAIIGAYLTKWRRLGVSATRSADDEKLFTEMRDSIRRLEDRVSNLERAVTTAETQRKFAL
jgi:asparagine synthetase A